MIMISCHDQYQKVLGPCRDYAAAVHGHIADMHAECKQASSIPVCPPRYTLFIFRMCQLIMMYYVSLVSTGIARHVCLPKLNVSPKNPTPEGVKGDQAFVPEADLSEGLIPSPKEEGARAL